MRKVLLLASFFVLAPLTLAISLSLLSLYFQNNLAFNQQSPKVAYAALPPYSGVLKPQVIQEDARIAVVRDFLQKYKSPLAPFADEIIASADKYGMDYRLIPAIAMQESTLCNKLPAKYSDTYNCWGFGIYGKKVTKFDNYVDAIDTVTKTLANKYKAIGLETPEQIMSKYTPSSNGSWANGVSIVMNRLDIAL